MSVASRQCKVHRTGLDHILVATLLALLASCLLEASFPSSSLAQEPLQAGEGFITRFSGVSRNPNGETVIDTDGTVGSIIDLRNPAQPPKGQHWLNEPQRNPVTAAQVGQVFGIAIDDAEKPNIYLTSTSAFGLHRTRDNADWMEGMWGRGAGPGTVWKLDGSAGYAPQPFATITLDGRQNSGAALGNIAYDRWNKQLYVSDLETGMIHRLRASDGAELGRFDHGIEARASFVDAVTGQQQSLTPVAFAPDTAARINDCPGGPFSQTPACWNLADFRRRVWGVGVRKDADTGEVRLFYAVWSSQGFGNPEFAAADDSEKSNSLWSIAIRQDGSLDTGSVRRETVLPDFFTNPADIGRAGKSHPVTDIAFPKCSRRNVMLVSERGGVRNLGLDTDNPFAAPHESRVLRYERDDAGIWQLSGRYDVGFFDRKGGETPYIRANSCGGIDFGYGYKQDWSIDPEKPDSFVWMNGDALCTPNAPCFVPEANKRIDGSHVHGTQGTPEFGFSEVLPPAATQTYPPSGEPYPPTGPTQSWMVDTDNNIAANGAPAMQSLIPNHATMIGDIEIHQPCDPDLPVDQGPPVVDEPPVIEEPPVVEEPPVIEEPPLDEGPDLEKTKTGPAQCVEGDICTFTITITNNGPGEWSGPLWELDTLPPGAILLDYRPQPDWLCNQTGDQAVCNFSWATLAPGDAVTLETDVFIPAGLAGQIVENCVDDIWLLSQDPNDPAVIQAIEQALSGSGYVVGPIDGVLDIVTMNAISQFQTDNGLPPTGLPDPVLMDLLFPGTASLPGDSNPVNDGDCHQVEILPPPAPPVATPPPPPDIQVVKIQTTGQCRPGGLCSFRIVFINRGPGEWTGVPEVIDTLPTGATLVNPPVGCSQAGNTVTCRYPQTVILPPNQPGSVTITVRMPNNLRPGAQNCVDLSPNAAAGDPNAGNNRQCIPVRVAQPPVPNIQIYKEQTGECHEGGTCTFDLWFINRGPGVWSDRIRLTDRLPSGAKLLKASPPWICNQTGTTVTCRRSPLRLNPGRATRVTITVQLPDELEENARNCVRISRPAGRNRDFVLKKDQHCIPIDVTEEQPPAKPTDISVDKEQTGTCEPGGICTFKLKFINNGPGSWTGKPEIRDEFGGQNPTITSWSPSTWTLKEDGTTFAHTEVTIPQGGHIELTFGLKLPEHADSEPAHDNCAVIDPQTMQTVDSNTANNRKCIPVEVVEPPEPVETAPPPAHDSDIEIEKMLAPYNPAGAAGGCETGCIIRLLVTNVGSASWSGPLVVRDMSLPPGTNLVRGMALSMAQPNWTCNTTGRCTNPSVRLEPGESKALDFYVTLSELPDGEWENCAEILNSGDQNRDNDRHCIDIPVTPPAAPPSEPTPPVKPPGNISVTKSQEGICRPGATCSFVIKFTNAGASVWNGTPRVSDVITAGGARVGAWSPQDWNCKTTAHATNCTHEDTTLSVGQSLSLKLSVSMPASLTSGARNCVIRLGPRDTNPGDDRQCIPIHTETPAPEYTPQPPTVVRPEPPAPPRVTTVHCPRGTVKRGNKCVRIPRRCPRGTVRRGNRCVTVTARCPRGTYRRGRVCVRPPRCPRGMTQIGRICVNIPGIIDTIRRPPKRHPPPRERSNCHRGRDGRIHCGPG